MLYEIFRYGIHFFNMANQLTDISGGNRMFFLAWLRPQTTSDVILVAGIILPFDMD
jgi:hypothetical protein